MDDDYDHDYEYEEDLLPEQEYDSILSEIYQDFLNYYNLSLIHISEPTRPY